MAARLRRGTRRQLPAEAPQRTHASHGPRLAEPRDEHVLERRRNRSHAVSDAAAFSAERRRRSAAVAVADRIEPDVRALAEHLHAEHAGHPLQERRPPGACRRAITSRHRPGSVAAQRVGASSASRRPSCSSATREQRSASSRYGVAITIVMPCARNSASSFQNSRRETGSTPVVGSSSTMSAGSWTSVQASASFCFMPPDSWSASRARNGVSWVSSSSRSRAAAVVAHAVDLGEERDVLVDAQIAVQAEALRQVADRLGEPPMLADRIEAEHADRAARRRCSRPQIIRIVVVLPAPSGPIRPNISPRSTVSDSSPTASDRPYRLTTPVERDGASSARTGSPPRPACRAFSTPVLVVHRHLHAVHELGAVLRGLHVARRELGPSARCS